MLVNYIINSFLRISSVFSIFSLRFVDFANNYVTTDISKVSNNYIMDGILDENYRGYNCKADSDLKKLRNSLGFVQIRKK